MNKKNVLEVLVLFEDTRSPEKEKHPDVEVWVPVKIALADFQDDNISIHENTVVVYLKELKDDDKYKKALCKHVANLSKMKVAELFPKMGRDVPAKTKNTEPQTKCYCRHDHNSYDDTNYEATPYPCYFDKDDSKGKFAGAKCRLCKNLMPCEGKRKVSEQNPAWVCKSLFRGESPSCLGTKEEPDGIVCNGCMVEKQPKGRRSRHR
jgi:hypothetical protein